VYRLVNCAIDEPNARWWRHFAQFMPFSSLGAKTTMGLGQCSVTLED
jgi:CRISPR/Cas system endoribonuclease Cas6 (RAMP superfamily)